MEGYVQRVASMMAAGPAWSNTAARNDLWVDGDEFLLPAGLWGTLSHRELYVQMAGNISTLNPTPGNLTFDVTFSGTQVWSGGAIPLNTAVAKTNEPWLLELWLSGRVIGSGTAGKLIGFGRFTSHAILGAPAQAAGGTPSFLLPFGVAAGQQGGGFDTRYNHEVSVGAQFSVPNAANSIQATQGFANIIVS